MHYFMYTASSLSIGFHDRKKHWPHQLPKGGDAVAVNTHVSDIEEIDYMSPIMSDWNKIIMYEIVCGTEMFSSRTN